MIRSRVRRSALAAATLLAGALGLAAFSANPARADNVPDVLPSHAELDIPAIAEKQAGWSWAAVGQMVMDYYNIPPLYGPDNWQCSLADYLTGVQACEAPKGMSAEQASLKLIQGYPAFAHKFFGEDPVVMRYQQHKVLSPIDAIHEIRFERPFIAVVQPPKMTDADKGGNAVVLVVGYEGGTDNLKLIVNDPRTYSVGADPYVDAGAEKRDVNGQYAIGYNDFVQQMKWTATIDWIKPQ
ncbi:MAG TPA: hypothetical protein VHE77_05745 [Dongiaceae bacterium]|jgi:hypothetical protein|nr:hypothetical protein [Dongiaceae bacterium]